MHNGFGRLKWLRHLAAIEIPLTLDTKCLRLFWAQHQCLVREQIACLPLSLFSIVFTLEIPPICGSNLLAVTLISLLDMIVCPFASGSRERIHTPFFVHR